MKHPLTVFCAAGTALVLAAGFFLPKALFALRDEQLAQQASAYSTEQVKFQASTRLSDTLLLLSESYSTLYVDASYARMSPEDAHAAAVKGLEALRQVGIFDGDPAAFTAYTVSPMMLFANSFASPSSHSTVEKGSSSLAGSSAAAASPAEAFSSEAQSTAFSGPSSPFSAKVSAVLWECTLSTDSSSSVYLTLDDATGLILTISYWKEGPSDYSSPLSVRWKNLKAFCDKSATFFTSYYSLPTSSIQYGDYPDSAEIILYTEDQQSLSLFVSYTSNSFYFWFN